MFKNKNYIGMQINKWTILDFEQDKHGGKWLCRCECGTEKWQKVCNIKNGKSKMCMKCSGKDRRKEKKPKKERIIKIRFDSNKDWSDDNTFIGTYKEYLEECKKRREERKRLNKHIPISYDRIYKIYQHMKERCYNSNSESYNRYGGRGIKICDEWIKSYKAFNEWAMSNGYRDDLSIDRIDVNGNYEPSNCRWATNKEQQNNKRNNFYIEYKGERKTLQQWSEEYGLCPDTIKRRLNRGIKVGEKLFCKRVNSKKYNKKKLNKAKKHTKDLKRARKELATVLKRVQVKKMLYK